MALRALRGELRRRSVLILSRRRARRRVFF
jgi:hypothetical protein